MLLPIHAKQYKRKYSDVQLVDRKSFCKPCTRSGIIAVFTCFLLFQSWMYFVLFATPQPELQDSGHHVHVVDDPQAVRKLMIERSMGAQVEKKKTPGKEREQDYVKKDRVYGVAPSDYTKYTDGFSCTGHDNQQVSVTFEMVNDDYCDCMDGEDEPGTSACGHLGRFFCIPEQKSLIGHTVNDMVCDCCDGSDEWENPANCPNSCEAMNMAQKKHQDILRQGKELRKHYIQQGEAARMNGEPWHHSDAFYPLAKNCLSRSQAGYLYRLCLFKSMEQSKNVESHSLGKSWRWIDENKLGVLSNGKMCPGGPARETRVTFECDIKDELVSVSESERCIYSAKVLTPAACV
eukprot:m.134225 g.134225  ORF g.134225 m.134225 type:complete len:348 (-) comp14690_c0_seq4:1829-2872(-)